MHLLMEIHSTVNICNLIASDQRVHTARPVNTNSLAFLVTGNKFHLDGNLVLFSLL